MKNICSFDDFVNLDKNRTIEKIILVDTNIHNENWPIERYVQYLGGLENHKQDTGIKINYDSLPDHKGRVGLIKVSIVIPSRVGSKEKNYYMNWNVKYKDN